MNRVPRCRLPPTPGANLVAASSAPEHCKLLPSSVLHAARRARRQQQHRRARARPFRPASHQTPSPSGKSLLLLLLPWWTLHDPGICEPGWAWAELELFPSTNPPAAPFTTPGDICRDPYRPGHVVVVLFCLRPINYPAPPPRHRPILSIRLCVTYTHTPSSPGGIHPSVDKYQPRPVFAIVYKSWLDHTCLTSSTTYISAQGSRISVHPASHHQHLSAKDHHLLLFYISTFLSLTVLASPPPPLPPTCTDSSCYHHNNNYCFSTITNSSTITHIHTPTLTHPRMCDFTKNYYIYSSCLDPGAHFFRTSVDGNRKLACPKGPHERYIVQPGTCPLCSG